MMASNYQKGNALMRSLKIKYIFKNVGNDLCVVPFFYKE